MGVQSRREERERRCRQTVGADRHNYGGVQRVLSLVQNNDLVPGFVRTVRENTAGDDRPCLRVAVKKNKGAMLSQPFTSRRPRHDHNRVFGGRGAAVR